ncbi:uncharacterized [Tachysurus ichikawai]
MEAALFAHSLAGGSFVAIKVKTCKYCLQPLLLRRKWVADILTNGGSVKKKLVTGRNLRLNSHSPWKAARPLFRQIYDRFALGLLFGNGLWVRPKASPPYWSLGADSVARFTDQRCADKNKRPHTFTSCSQFSSPASVPAQQRLMYKPVYSCLELPLAFFSPRIWNVRQKYQECMTG